MIGLPWEYQGPDHVISHCKFREILSRDRKQESPYVGRSV